MTSGRPLRIAKREIGNQDHSLMQGVELVDRRLDGAEEKVFRT